MYVLLELIKNTYNKTKMWIDQCGFSIIYLKLKVNIDIEKTIPLNSEIFFV